MPIDLAQRDVPEPHRARAPYNFVPLPERILTVAEPFAAHDHLDPGRLHGEIELTITTETPLYTRAAHDPGDGAKALDSEGKQRFFHHGDPARPALPGASLRGMTRSICEILSYSRIARRGADGTANRLVDERLIYRAVADQRTRPGKAYKAVFLGGTQTAVAFPSERIQAGYLVQTPDGWAIRPAQSLGPSGGTPLLSRTFVRVNCNLLSKNFINVPALSATGPNPTIPVWVDRLTRRQSSKQNGKLIIHYLVAESVSSSAQPGFSPGWIVPSGDTPPGGRHMHTAVFEPDPGANLLHVPRTVWRQFEEDQGLTRGLPCRQVAVGEPVFYFLDGSGSIGFLGPTLFFRIPYPHSTADFVPPGTMGSASDALDLAEAIFGTVNPGHRDSASASLSGGAHRGRVFFDDAAWDGRGGDPFLDRQGGQARYPKILSSPKPTSYQHYLVQQATLQQNDSEMDRKNNLVGYESTPPSGTIGTTVLRGFKRYWHRSESATRGALQTQQPLQSPDQYTAIRPVRAQVTFVGRVRFENLSAMELGALLTSLDLPETCRHKLGMGKPLGLGTVKVVARLRLFDPRARYLSLGNLGWKSDSDAEQIAIDARNAFARTVITHHRGSYPESRLDVDKVDDLWRIPRLAELRVLLEQSRKPSDETTRYLTVEVGGYGPNANEFKARKVLPRASEIASASAQNLDPVGRPVWPAPGASAVSSGIKAPAAAPRQTGGVRGTQAQPAPTPSQHPLLAEIGALPDAKIAGSFADLCDRWSKLDDPSVRQTIGLALRKKVDKGWRGGKDKSRYKELVTWLEAQPAKGK